MTMGEGGTRAHLNIRLQKERHMSRGMVNLPSIVGLGMILMVGVLCGGTEPVNGAGGLLPEGGIVTTIATW